MVVCLAQYCICQGSSVKLLAGRQAGREGGSDGGRSEVARGDLGLDVTRTAKCIDPKQAYGIGLLQTCTVCAGVGWGA
jgi:hypothetical protein